MCFPFKQKRRIDNDDDGSGIVRQSAHDGTQNVGDGQKDCDEVQRHGKGQIVLDSSHHLTGQRQEAIPF